MTASSDETEGKNQQLRPGLWTTVNERYPGAMITKPDFVPLAKLNKLLSEARVTFVSTAGVQPRGTVPFDTVHPVGDYTFRRVPSGSKPAALEIHQLKYPTAGTGAERGKRNRKKIGFKKVKILCHRFSPSRWFRQVRFLTIWRRV